MRYKHTVQVEVRAESEDLAVALLKRLLPSTGTSYTLIDGEPGNRRVVADICRWELVGTEPVHRDVERESVLD